MITLEQYFGQFQYGLNNLEMRANATELLSKVNKLINAFGVPINPATGSQISGQSFGGWRPYDCSIGAPSSAHKMARAVDIYDPEGHLDDWLNDNWLEIYDLYREDPGSTRGWCHLTDRPPLSGKRTFYP